MGSDQSDGAGVAYGVKCVVRDAFGNQSASYGIVGVPSASGRIPGVSGEELWRHATHGYTELLNSMVAASLPSGSTTGEVPVWNDTTKGWEAGGSYIGVGTTFATAGTIRGPQLFSLQSLTNSGSDMPLIRTYASDNVDIGDNSKIDVINVRGQESARLYAGGSLIVHAETGDELAFYGATPVTKPEVTGSASSNAALASLLTALENLGLITDSST
jgi:hypothetical protein